jgi:hypothetical protein
MSRKKTKPRADSIECKLPAAQTEREQSEGALTGRAYVYARTTAGGRDALEWQVRACAEWAQEQGIEPVLVVSDECSGVAPFEERAGGRLLPGPTHHNRSFWRSC